MNKSKWAKFSMTFLLGLSILVSGCTSAAASTGTIQATVERTADSKVHISWDAHANPEKVQIFWSTSPENIEEQGKHLVTVTGESAGITINDPSPGARPYFHIKSTHGAVTVAERLLPLQGASNYRDLGGYQTADGRTVKWGKLFRSDELYTLTEADQKYLQNSGLKLIIDYRTDKERVKKLDPAMPGVDNIRLTIDQDIDLKAIYSGDLSSLGKPGESLIRLNKKLVNTTVEYTKLFELALDAQNLPFVQHCTAGKDRTGFGSALLLLALGVPEQVVMEDYLLSNTYRQEYNEKALQQFKPLLKDANSQEIFQALLDVREEYLQTAFHEIKQQYGSYDNYLEQALGLTDEERKKLQDLYLEGSGEMR